MKGRIAQVKLTEDQLNKLLAGGRVSVRLPKDVALLRLSLKEGDVFEQVWAGFDKVWKEFDEMFRKLPWHK
jgi:hypothetical protein